MSCAVFVLESFNFEQMKKNSFFICKFLYGQYNQLYYMNSTVQSTISASEQGLLCTVINIQGCTVGKDGHTLSHRLVEVILGIATNHIASRTKIRSCIYQ